MKSISLLFLLIGAFSIASRAQTPTPDNPTASSFRIEGRGTRFGGELYITVGGKEEKITEAADKAWIIKNGAEVVYVSPDGAGGFEDEGQALHIYNVETRRTREILSEYYMVDEVKEARVSTGAIALLVSMSDGNAGNPYFAVVDPKRGEVFFRRFAKLAEINGDRIKLAFYRNGDWDQPYPPKDDFSAKPYKTKSHDLKKVLKNKVICNEFDEIAESKKCPK